MNIAAILKITTDLQSSSVLDLSTVKDALLHEIKTTLSTGTSANQADKVWHDRRTLGAGVSESLDLAGSLTDAFGATVTMAKIKGVLIYNRETTTGLYLQVGGAASNAWSAGMLVDATDKIKIGPSGYNAWASPIDGYAVTAGTGDILKIDNPSAAAVTYDIIIIGTSA